MTVKDVIDKRQTIREYEKRELDEKIITELLDAARKAPSAYNAQPWRYYIIKDKEVKNRLRENNVFKKDFIYDAPVIIVCTADTTVYKEHPASDYALVSLSISSSFLILQAAELGLGTCIVGNIERDELKKAIGIPAAYIVPYVITLGYPERIPEKKPKKDVKDILNFVA